MNANRYTAAWVHGPAPHVEGDETFMITARVDDRYRIVLPPEARTNIRPGDVLYFEERTEDGMEVMRFAKASNALATMLDALADEAEQEDHRGETVALRDLAEEFGVKLSDGR